MLIILQFQDIFYLLYFNSFSPFTQARSDINLKRAAVLKALCIYLGEDDGHLIREYKASHCNCIYQSDVLSCIIKFKILMSLTH